MRTRIGHLLKPVHTNTVITNVAWLHAFAEFASGSYRPYIVHISPETRPLNLDPYLFFRIMRPILRTTSRILLRSLHLDSIFYRKSTTHMSKNNCSWKYVFHIWLHLGSLISLQGHEARAQDSTKSVLRILETKQMNQGRAGKKHHCPNTNKRSAWTRTWAQHSSRRTRTCTQTHPTSEDKHKHNTNTTRTHCKDHRIWWSYMIIMYDKNKWSSWMMVEIGQTRLVLGW